MAWAQPFGPLLLGMLVQPSALPALLPLGLLMAVVLPLARLLVVRLVMPASTTSWRDRLIVTG